MRFFSANKVLEWKIQSSIWSNLVHRLCNCAPSHVIIRSLDNYDDVYNWTDAKKRLRLASTYGGVTEWINDGQSVKLRNLLKKIQTASYWRRNIMDFPRSCFSNVHVAATLKKHLRSLKITISVNVMYASHQKRHAKSIGFEHFIH